jgi:SnoaL-like domain
MQLSGDWQDRSVTEDADIVLELAAAIEARDWDRVEQLLHPYVHWRDSAGVVRGRTNVLRHLSGSQSIAAPASWELRDGQVYRWNAGW